MMVNITMSSHMPYNHTDLILKRKKICRKSDTKSIASNESADKVDDKIVRVDEPVLATNPSAYESYLYIIVGCASGLILVVGVLALSCYFYYVRPRKERQTQTAE